MSVGAAEKVERKSPTGEGGAARAYEALVLEHTSLVRRIAHQFIRRIPPHVEIADLIQAGMVGLLEAAQKHASDRGASFNTYASFRIRGAIVDYLRETNWTPRSLYRRLRDIEKAKHRLENPTPAQVASALGVSLEDYHRTLRDATRSRPVSLDGTDSGDAQPFHDEIEGSSSDPADEMEQENFRRLVAAAVDALPERERVVLLLHYDAGLVLREIGDQFELSESRICQLHKRAIERLRAVAQAWMRAATSNERST